jgi:hypothetical protein
MYVDADGTRHVIGFVHLSLPPAEQVLAGAESLRTRSLGLAFTRADVGSAIAFGYSDTTLLFIRNDSCVRFDPVSSVLPLEGRSYAANPRGR